MWGVRVGCEGGVVGRGWGLGWGGYYHMESASLASKRNLNM